MGSYNFPTSYIFYRLKAYCIKMDPFVCLFRNEQNVDIYTNIYMNVKRIYLLVCIGPILVLGKYVFNFNQLMSLKQLAKDEHRKELTDMMR